MVRTGAQGYHGAENVANDDSLSSITNNFTQIEMANNTHMQMLNNNTSTITDETCDLHTIFVST